MQSPADVVQRRRRPVVAAVVICALLLVTLGSASSAAGAAESQAGQDAGSLLVVLDASGSMLRPDASGQTRMVSAKRAIAAVVSKIPGQTPMGIRVFGTGGASSRSRAACTDSRLLVPITRNSAARAVSRVAGVQARGWTPIGYALQQSAADLQATRDGFGTVVLVSDGVDECYPGFGPEPCDVARSVSSPAIRLRVHTIGFTVDAAARAQLRCIARVTGGRYTDAADADSLADALRNGLLPAAPLLKAPAEPRRPQILATVARVLALVALLTGSVVLVRSLLRRRRRSYW
jgi:Ca-activated chloride channel homolog